MYLRQMLQQNMVVRWHKILMLLKRFDSKLIKTRFKLDKHDFVKN